MPSVFSHASAPVAIGGAAVAGPSRCPSGDSARWARWCPTPGLWRFFFLATASHGLLDAMTNGGLGVAFFAPFCDTRYFLPWQPIVVSPAIDPRALRSAWPAGDVERARLGLVAGGPDLPGRSGHSAAPGQVGCRNALWSRVIRGEGGEPMKYTILVYENEADFSART